MSPIIGLVRRCVNRNFAELTFLSWQLSCPLCSFRWIVLYVVWLVLVIFWQHILEQSQEPGCTLVSYQLPRCSLPPTCTAGRALSRCRITTTLCTAKKSARWIRSAAIRASVWFRGVRLRAAVSPAIARATRKAKRIAARRTHLPTVFPIETKISKSWIASLNLRTSAASSRRRSRSWLLHQRSVSAPIIGASKPHHLPEAVAALSIKPSDEECKFLEEPYQPLLVLGHS